MAVVKNRFLDPANGNEYTWHINHGWDGDENSGLQLPVSWATSTGGAPVPQYGEIQPSTMTLRGTILHRAQHEAMQIWTALSANQTIYFRDFDNIEYEVVIQKFSWSRQGCMRNPSDPTMPFHTIKYELEMSILGVVGL